MDLFKSIVLCWLPALSGAFFKPGNWYANLVKPPLNPPGWVFGPVWTFLYLSMGVCLWLVRKQPEQTDKSKGLKWFYLQLLLNAAWTPAFFGANRMGIAALILFALILSIIACIFYFLRVKKGASFLLLPYLLWCCFAFYLNVAYYVLNRGQVDF